jgi:hypothetical protein
MESHGSWSDSTSVQSRLYRSTTRGVIALAHSVGLVLPGQPSIYSKLTTTAMWHGLVMERRGPILCTVYCPSQPRTSATSAPSRQTVPACSRPITSPRFCPKGFVNSPQHRRGVFPGEKPVLHRVLRLQYPRAMAFSRAGILACTS